MGRVQPRSMRSRFKNQKSLANNDGRDGDLHCVLRRHLPGLASKNELHGWEVLCLCLCSQQEQTCSAPQVW
jgi:hypothetical protein